MPIVYIVAAIVAAYFFTVFVVVRLLVPFTSFKGLSLPPHIPQEIQNKISQLESQSHSALEFLQLAYNFVSSRWHAGRLDTIWNARLGFRNDLASIWEQPGYAHCNTQNYILFVLLVGSKFFTTGDIRLKTVFFNFFIHQYLQVRAREQLFDVDPAGASIRGQPFGSHIEFFG